MTIAANSLSPKPEKVYTLQAYLDREAKAAHKSCFYNGTIIKMAGAKVEHNKIAANMLFALGLAVRQIEQTTGEYFEVCTSDQRVYIEKDNVVVYPDALVVYQKTEHWEGRKDLLTNPLLIVEVLSKSTNQYDKGAKFILYSHLPSFREYVLIEQDSPNVIVWTKNEEQFWSAQEYELKDENIVLKVLNQTSIALSEIYRGISF